ncbi:type VI secretion system protein TssA [Massilia sp. erpn]|uniref:type VI secretion system protein TssA n=1 Tax=Massilia sp. erpn TaxID=2738142 RepID=UPI002101DB3F|nr:type VI secretion system protein TssA [Massilia sp. erpn]UTY58622.1 type VI secretion system protein TssA [Massilia sp. erpn]
MFSIENLLQPVSAEHPCGEDIAFGAEVDEIAKARSSDDPALDQGEWQRTLKEADWPFVARRSAELIQTRSKDLRLAVWLAEAQARTRGFCGLGDGLQLLAGLCDRYWDGLYPAAEDGDCEQRIGNLAWLVGGAAQWITQIPVTEDGTLSIADFEAARQRGRQPAAANAGWGSAPPPAGPSIEELDARRRGNSAQFNERLMQDASHCLQSMQMLESVLETRLGESGPGFAPARDALQDAIAFIALLLPAGEVPASERSAANDAGQFAGAESSEASLPSGRAGGNIAPAATAGMPASRVQALAQLRQVADFFRRTEPHSPVAYLAEKAAAWGEMPLHQWLHAVVKEQAALSHLDELLGITPPAQ